MALDSTPIRSYCYRILAVRGTDVLSRQQSSGVSANSRRILAELTEIKNYQNCSRTGSSTGFKFTENEPQLVPPNQQDVKKISDGICLLIFE